VTDNKSHSQTATASHSRGVKQTLLSRPWRGHNSDMQLRRAYCVPVTALRLAFPSCSAHNMETLKSFYPMQYAKHLCLLLHTHSSIKPSLIQDSRQKTILDSNSYMCWQDRIPPSAADAPRTVISIKKVSEETLLRSRGKSHAAIPHHPCPPPSLANNRSADRPLPTAALDKNSHP